MDSNNDIIDLMIEYVRKTIFVMESGFYDECSSINKNSLYIRSSKVSLNINKFIIIKLLLDNGANINHIDKNGAGVFDIWSSNKTKIFLKKYTDDLEELEVKEVEKWYYNLENI